MTADRATEVAGKVYDLTQDPSENVRNEVNASFAALTPQDTEAATQKLFADNVLPHLLLEEFSHIDADGDTNVSYVENLAAMESEEATTRIAAEYANRYGVNDKLPGVNYDTYSLADVTADVELFGDAQRPGDSDDATEDPDLYQHTGDDSDAPAEGEHQPLQITVNYDPKAVLENPDSSTEAQLTSILALVRSGNAPTTIKDENGNDIQVRMEVVPVAEGSDRSFVHMFAVDPETGAEIPILRAINEGNSFEPQRSADGEEVPFVGTKWKRAHPDTMFGD